MSCNTYPEMLAIRAGLDSICLGIDNGKLWEIADNASKYRIEIQDQLAAAPTDIALLLAEVRRLRCCGNCEHFETVCGEGKCFVECENPAWRFDKKVRYTDGSGKCEKWEAACNG